ncbi:unnamed protein product [Urochloa decumbens]|uniref:Ubiquitin fusion degradation protein 1 n=1 Tax=Urochloa decumbens TaxID=240449 RepID=A0ABC8ZAL7_9POAL
MFFALAAARRLVALRGVGTFEETYRCLPPSYAANPNLEDGDKVLLPVSALHRLTTLRVDYPMLFQLRAAAADQPHNASHCGVLEFVADEGTVVMPRWMMANLGLGEGAAVRVRSAAALPKATYVKIQPHTSAFLDVSNPKAVLEKTLRTFTCFTTGDTVMVSYNGKSYYIDIVETRPAAAVCIIETDCEVDFAPPLDYKEPEKPVPVRLPPVPAVAVPASVGKAPAGDDGAVVKDEPKFKPFTGSGKRLDGKASAPQASSSEGAFSTVACSAAPSGSNNGGGKQQQASASAAATSSGASSSSGRQKSGKLVFGSSSSGTSKSSNSKEEPQNKAVGKQQAAEEPTKKDEPKFQAFTGKSYSLMKR